MKLSEAGVKARKHYLDALVKVLGEEETSRMLENPGCLGALNVMADKTAKHGVFPPEMTANLLARIVLHYFRSDTEAFRRVISADPDGLKKMLEARK